MHNMNNIYPTAQYYAEVLTEDQIVSIGLIVKEFALNRISYQTLIEQINALNVFVTPVAKTLSSSDVSEEEKNETYIRYTNNEYKGDDIKYYILSTFNHPKIVFQIDDFLIETLAKAGDIDAQATLKNDLLRDLEDFISSQKRQGRKAKKIIQNYLDRINYLDKEIKKKRTL